MDSNQTNQPIMPNVTPAEANSLVNSTPNTASSGGGGGSKMIWIMIVVIVLLVIVGGGAYWYFVKQKASPTNTNNQPVSVQTGDLQNELQADQVTDPQGDFTEIDKDIQSL